MSRTFLLQDWTTIRSGITSAILPFVQDPDAWLDLNGYSDVVCWIEIAEVTPPGGRTNWLTLTLQTAPSCDDANFVPMAPPINVGIQAPFVQASSTPTVIRSALSTTSNNLMRYLRWSIRPLVASAWDITFRIHAIASRSTTFVPPLLPGCVIWYRPDLGVTTSGTGISQWNDQSGTNDTNKNLASSHIPGLNIADPNYNNQPTLTFVAANTTYLTSTTFTTPIAQPNTWVIVGHTPTSAAYQIITDANDMVSGQYIGRTNTGTTIIQSVSVGLSTSFAWSSPSVVLAEFNGASSKIFINNLTTAAATGNAGSGAGSSQNSLTVGCQDAAWGPQNYWDGSIAEIIGYSKLLSVTDKARLRNYLRGRYGLSIG